MSAFYILIRSGLRARYHNLAKIGFMTVLSLACVICSISLFVGGNRSVDTRMETLGYGDVTVWVSEPRDSLVEDISNVKETGSLKEQKLILAGYKICDKYSDNEGQLIFYDEEIPYQFIDGNGKKLDRQEIKKGEIYISPALASSFDVSVGTDIAFEYSRNEKPIVFTVKGYFADAFMGSSMIDMKSFLISKEDFDSLSQNIKNTKESDALANEGAMLHIWGEEDYETDNLLANIMEETELSLYTQFAYTKESILSYQTLLQNILCALLGVFSILMFVMGLIATARNLSDTIEEDMGSISALRMIGAGGKIIRHSFLVMFIGVTFISLILAIPIGIAMSKLIAVMLVSSTGQLVDINVPPVYVFVPCIVLVLVQTLFMMIRTRHILSIRPVMIGREEKPESQKKFFQIKKPLPLSLAVREVTTGKRKYIGLFVIAMLLTFFLSVVGRMSAWLGPNGEGLMNSFSVADHDLGVQPFNNTVPMDEIRRAIEWYSPIKETYEIAMQPVYVNGREYTANVLNDNSYFHILKGKAPEGMEVLLTDTVASELGMEIGDSVQITGTGRTENYIVSGIYMCANGMGSNIGMDMSGYSMIGNINGYIWCHHYIIENGQVRDYAAAFLQENYKGIDVHTNSWSGLDGIVNLLHLMIIVIYAVSAIFIAVTVALITVSLIRSEQGTYAIYKTIGMSSKEIRLSFALRFAIVVSLGSLVGLILSVLFANKLIETVFVLAGIGEFRVREPVLSLFIPFVMVLFFFFCFALWSGGKADKDSVISVIKDDE